MKSSGKTPSATSRAPPKWWRSASPATTTTKAALRLWKSVSRCSPERRVSGLSLHLQAGRLHHLGPFRGLVGDELAEFRRAHRHHLAAELVEALFELRIGQHRIDGGVEFFDDFGRHAFRPADAVPHRHLVARHGFA